MPRKVDLTGKTFGYLTVVEQGESSIACTGKPIVRWDCACKCGNMALVPTTKLNNGHTSSCGCYAKEIRKTVNVKHGLRYHPLYKLWGAIRGRTRNCPKYVGKGRDLDPGWLDNPEAFIEYVETNLSDKPTPRHSLDRIDNNLGYVEGNIRWADSLTQANNRPQATPRTFRGEVSTMTLLCLKYGVVKHNIQNSMRRQGLTFEEAMNRQLP